MFDDAVRDEWAAALAPLLSAMLAAPRQQQALSTASPATHQASDQGSSAASTVDTKASRGASNDSASTATIQQMIQAVSTLTVFLHNSLARPRRKSGIKVRGGRARARNAPRDERGRFLVKTEIPW